MIFLSFFQFHRRLKPTTHIIIIFKSCIMISGFKTRSAGLTSSSLPVSELESDSLRLAAVTGGFALLAADANDKSSYKAIRMLT